MLSSFVSLKPTQLIYHFAFVSSPTACVCAEVSLHTHVWVGKHTESLLWGWNSCKAGVLWTNGRPGHPPRRQPAPCLTSWFPAAPAAVAVLGSLTVLTYLPIGIPYTFLSSCSPSCLCLTLPSPSAAAVFFKSHRGEDKSRGVASVVEVVVEKENKTGKREGRDCDKYVSILGRNLHVATVKQNIYYVSTIKTNGEMPLLSSLWETEVMSFCQHKQTLLFLATVCDTFV